ncbi:MAG: zinc ribbon domain-containing protein [Desulfobulbaceae bacterium]|nr:zinc ribbon domain-containing protein [Desulfobulbaceae bacterium]
MPIYEYECQKCGNVTEAWQSMSDAPLTTCSDCQGELKKLISSSSFQLKGGGWYADGYSSTNNGAKAESNSKPAPAKECSKAASCPCAS